MIRSLNRFVGLCLGLAMLCQTGIASTLDKLAECRASSTDNFSFLECIDLQHQDSATLLTGIEESWRQYMAAEPSQVNSESAASVSGNENIVNEAGANEAGANEAANNNRSAEQGSAEPFITEQRSQSGVIAIVSDETVSEATGQSRILNISDQILDESQFNSLLEGEKTDVSLLAQRKRFEDLPALFRSYRDQRCAWEAGLYGADRVGVYVTACKTWLNEQRARDMRSQLSEKRASDSSGTFFRGFYIEDGEGGIMQSCDRRREWRISGDPLLVGEIASRYDSITDDNLEMAYLELRGDLRPIDVPEAGLSGRLQVRTVGLLRAIVESDCISAIKSSVVAGDAEFPAQSAGTEVPVIESEVPDYPSPEDITVDALGDSGFLYGYFTNWVSACAVEQNSVCKAQTDADYSNQGEWVLTVDRSLESEWRIRLIPTTSATVVGRAITIKIDGGVAASRPVSSDQTLLEMDAGITVAHGESARELISRMRNGQRLSLAWSTETDNSNELFFSLVGITRALQFFDQSG